MHLRCYISRLSNLCARIANESYARHPGKGHVQSFRRAIRARAEPDRIPRTDKSDERWVLVTMRLKR